MPGKEKAIASILRTARHALIINEGGKERYLNRDEMVARLQQFIISNGLDHRTILANQISGAETGSAANHTFVELYVRALNFLGQQPQFARRYVKILKNAGLRPPLLVEAVWEDVLKNRDARDKEQASRRQIRDNTPLGKQLAGHPIPEPIIDAPIINQSERYPERQCQEIVGLKQVMQAAINIIRKTSEIEPRHRAILIAQDGRAFNKYPELLKPWRDALHTALKNKWKVCQLWRLTDKYPSTTVVGDVLMFARVDAALYEPRYFEDLNNNLQAPNIVCVPGEALFSLTTDSPEEDDAGALHFTNEPPESLCKHFDLLRRQTVNLVRFHRESETEWTTLVADIENKPGERLLVQHYLSSITRPLGDYEKGAPWYERHANDPDRKHNVEALIAARQQRVKQLESQKESYAFRQICSQQALEEWVRRGSPESLKDNDRPEERKARLKNTIRLLKECDKFEIALSDAFQDEEALDTRRGHWFVKPNAATALIEIWYPENERPVLIYAEINEPTCALAFKSKFEELWRKAPIRDKEAVITWFKEKINEVPGYVRKKSHRRRTKEQLDDGLPRDHT